MDDLAGDFDPGYFPDADPGDPYGVTVLTALPSRVTGYRHRAAKLWTVKDGKPVDEGYGHAARFAVQTARVPDLGELFRLVTCIAGAHARCIVRGDPRPETDRWDTRRRLEHFAETPRSWAALDFDSVPCPFDPLTESGLVASFLRELLPVEFHHAGCILQFTASQGLKPGIRARLWFMLNKPLSGDQLKAWLAGCQVDPSVFGTVAVTYTADPQFAEGIVNPVGKRWHRIAGEPAVAVPAVIPDNRPKVVRDVASGPGLGSLSVETWFSLMGDGGELAGFYQPLLSAAGKFVAARSADQAWADAPAFKAAVRGAIDAAPKGSHRGADVERYRGDPFLDELLGSLIARDTARRERHAAEAAPTIAALRRQYERQEQARMDRAAEARACGADETTGECPPGAEAGPGEAPDGQEEAKEEAPEAEGPKEEAKAEEAPEDGYDDSPPQTAGEWMRPLDLLGGDMTPPVGKLDEFCLPASILALANSEAARINCAPHGIAAAAVGVAASVMRHDWRITLKFKDRAWTQPALLWIGIVAPPGSRKSAQFGSAHKPLDAIEKEFREDYMAEMRAYAEECKDAAKDKEAPPSPPVQERLVVQNSTPEKLAQILSQVARKLVYSVDELSSFFSSIDRYSHGGNSMSAARGDWLSAYEGGPKSIDRVKGTIYVPNWMIGVLGTIQTELLKQNAKALTSDGMMQRLCCVFPEMVSDDMEADDDCAADAAVIGNYELVIRALHEMEPPMRRFSSAGPTAPTVIEARPVEASATAQPIRVKACTLYKRIENDPTLPKHLRQTAGKWTGLLARLSLVFHGILLAERVACGEKIDEIARIELADSTVAMAAEFIRKVVIPSTFKLYDAIGFTTASSDAHWIAGHILAHELAKVTPREIGRVHRPLKGNTQAIVTAMEILEHSGWARKRVTGYGQQPAWDINPYLQAEFAARAEAERERRAEIVRQVRKWVAGMAGDPAEGA